MRQIDLCTTCKAARDALDMLEPLGDPERSILGDLVMIEGHNFNPQTHQEVVKTGFILGVFSNGESQNKEVWWRRSFYKAVNLTKKVTPFDFSMRLGEKTGMGRALGMPREFVDGNFWVGDCDVQPFHKTDSGNGKVLWFLLHLQQFSTRERSNWWEMAIWVDSH